MPMFPNGLKSLRDLFRSFASVTPTLSTLSLSSALTSGTAVSGTILGAYPGSTITTSGVTGLTVNSAARTFAFDGTGTAITVPTGLTEALAGAANSPKTSPVSIASASVGPTTAGLLYKSDGTLTGWTGNDGTWSAVAKPMLVNFDRSPIVAQAPGAAGTSDAGGNREGFLFTDTDGSWYMCYGAGDGTAGAGGPWRVQMSKSTDRGLTWTKLGVIIGLDHGYDSGSWPATDNLFMEKRAGVYYIHRLTAGNVSSNIPSSSYTADVWTATSPTGPYTYLNNIVTIGTPGAFDGNDAYSSCMVLDAGGTYHLFYSATNGGTGRLNSYQVGRATSTSPTGPFTKTGSPVLPTAIKGQPENPEVYFHAGLNKWVMTTNQVNIATFKTYKNRVFYSDSLTDWSAATWEDYTRVDIEDGTQAIGMVRFNRGPDNMPLLDSLGNMAVNYDTDPTDANHVGRKLYWTQLEPSLSAIAHSNYTPTIAETFATDTVGGLAGQNGWVDASSGGAAPPAVVSSGGANVLDLGSAPGSGTAFGRSLQTGIGTIPGEARYSAVGNFADGAGFGIIIGYQMTAGQTADGNNYNALSYLVANFSLTGCTFSYWNGTTLTTLSSAGYSLQANVDHVFEVSVENIAGLYTAYLHVDGFCFTYFRSSTSNRGLFLNGYAGIMNQYTGTGQRYIKSFGVEKPVAASTAALILPRANADFVHEFAVRTPNLGGFVDLFYRSQSQTAVTDCYRIRIDFTALFPIVNGVFKRVGGVETAITNSSSTKTQTAVSGTHLRIKVSMAGSAINVIADGETQFTGTDATFASGVSVGMLAGQGDFAIRNGSFRASNVVTVNNVTSGQVVTLRGAGGIPLATTTATGSSVIIPYAHFPAASIDVAGVQRYAPIGGVWGGDVYN